MQRKPLKDATLRFWYGETVSERTELVYHHYCFLQVGAKPRGPGMERGDLLRDNGNIFRGQGQAINKTADRSNLRVVVVGNPANTNAWIASQNAPDVDPKCFTAMTRLDHNRGLAQLSERTGFGVSDIHKFAIWGNHSSTQYPDVNHATVGGKSLKEVINDDQWTKEVFIPTVSVPYHGSRRFVCHNRSEGGGRNDKNEATRFETAFHKILRN